MSMNPAQYKQESTKSKLKTEFKAGTAFGRITQIVNLGVQHQTMWNTTTKQAQKLYWLPKEEQTQSKKQTVVENDNPVKSVVFKVTVEFPKIRALDENGEDKGPGWLSREFKASEKALAEMAESFGTDSLGDLLGKAVSVVVAFTTGGKPKMKSISAAPEEVTVPEVENKDKLVVFDFYNPDMEVYDKLYTFIQDTLKSAMDFDGSKLQNALSTAKGFDVVDTGFDSDVPLDEDLPEI